MDKFKIALITLLIATVAFVSFVSVVVYSYAKRAGEETLDSSPFIITYVPAGFAVLAVLWVALGVVWFKRNR